VPHGRPKRPRGGSFKRPSASAGAPRRIGRGRSRTQTRTKQKRKKGYVTNNASGNASSSTTRMGRRARGVTRLMKRVIGKQADYRNASAQLVSTTGKQGVFGFAFNTPADMRALKLASQGGVATDNTTNLFVYDSKQRFHLKNQSNHLVKMTLYDIRMKRMATASAWDTPIKAWTKGLTDMGAAADHYQQISQTPTFSPEFRHSYQILSTTNVNLEPGQQHEHSIYQLMNRKFETTVFDGSAFLSLPGMTTHLLVVFHGSLGHESATPGTVTFMAATLDYAFTFERKFGWVPQALPAYTLTSTLPTALIDPDHMGDSGDADVNNIAA